MSGRADLEDVRELADDGPRHRPQRRVEHLVHVGAYLRRAQEARQVVPDAELEGARGEGQGLVHGVGKLEGLPQYDITITILMQG